MGGMPRLIHKRTLSLILIGVAIVGCSSPYHYTNGVKPVIKQLEAYKANNGVYPSDLATAGITLPEAGYGGWKYASLDNNTRFSLSIGDYGRNGFVLYWDSIYGNWTMDD